LYTAYLVKPLIEVNFENGSFNVFVKPTDTLLQIQ